MASAVSLYGGPERRHNRMYITRHHEYHCRDGVCVAVRDNRSGAFIPEHGAIGRRFTGTIRYGARGIEGIAKPEDATTGARLHFANGVEDPHSVLTTELVAIERPEKAIVDRYPPTHLHRVQ